MAQISKITEGHVEQVFDTDLNRFVSQRFVVVNPCLYEVDGKVVYHNPMPQPEQDLPFDMVQPEHD